MNTADERISFIKEKVVKFGALWLSCSAYSAEIGLSSPDHGLSDRDKEKIITNIAKHKATFKELEKEGLTVKIEKDLIVLDKEGNLLDLNGKRDRPDIGINITFKGTSMLFSPLTSQWMKEGGKQGLDFVDDSNGYKGIAFLQVIKNGSNTCKIDYEAPVIYLEPGAKFPTSTNDFWGIVKSLAGLRHDQTRPAEIFLDEMLSRLEKLGFEKPTFEIHSHSLGSQSAVANAATMSSRNIPFKLFQHEPFFPLKALETQARRLGLTKFWMDKIMNEVSSNTESILIFPRNLATAQKKADVPTHIIITPTKYNAPIGRVTYVTSPQIMELAKHHRVCQFDDKNPFNDIPDYYKYFRETHIADNYLKLIACSESKICSPNNLEPGKDERAR